MSTRVQRAWNVLVETTKDVDAVAVNSLRTWMAGELMRTSRKLPPLLKAAAAEPLWSCVWEMSPGTLATSERAEAEFLAALGGTPPTHDPVRVFEWARSSLWALGVFTLPDDCCDNDQFDLEVWVEASSGSAVLSCQLGEWFAFRDRFPSEWAPLERWTGDTATLRPATRAEVRRLLPTADC